MQMSFLPWIGLLLSIAGGAFSNVFQSAPVKIIGSIILYFGGSILLLNVSSPQTCAALLICGIGNIGIDGLKCPQKILCFHSHPSCSNALRRRFRARSSVTLTLLSDIW